MAKTIRVLVVDPYPVVREGITSLLTSASDLELVADVAPSSEVLHLCPKHQPDLLVMGLVECDAASLRLIQTVKQISPNVKILTLVAQGQTDRQIGQTLGIQVATVRFHLRNVYKRLEVSNRVEAVVKAIEQS